MNIFNQKITAEDFLLICRTCFSKENSAPIEGDVLKLLKIVPDLQVDLEDKLPSQICKDCINKLQEISSFITSIKNNDLHLKKILEESNSSDHECISDEVDTLDQKEQSIGINFSENSKPNLQFKCLDCNKSFLKQSILNIHKRTHTKENPHECNICHKQFRYATNLRRHVRIVHNGLKPFKCETCGKKFATRARITEHTRIHTGERPYGCDICGFRFKKHSTYYSHQQRHKAKSGQIPSTTSIRHKYPRITPDPSQLQCSICGKVCSSKNSLSMHIKSHTGERTFLCTVCGKSFVRKCQLDIHSRIHTGDKPYECTTCGKFFRQLAAYRNHLLIHNNKRSFKCEFCQKTFIQSGHLHNHLKTHTGEKPYKCTFCNKAFTQNGNLKAHTRIHTNERPYKCTNCYLAFYDSSSLKKHVLCVHRKKEVKPEARDDPGANNVKSEEIMVGDIDAVKSKADLLF